MRRRIWSFGSLVVYVIGAKFEHRQTVIVLAQLTADIELIPGDLFIPYRLRARHVVSPRLPLRIQRPGPGDHGRAYAAQHAQGPPIPDHFISQRLQIGVDLLRFAKEDFLTVLQRLDLLTHRLLSKLDRDEHRQLPLHALHSVEVVIHALDQDFDLSFVHIVGWHSKAPFFMVYNSGRGIKKPLLGAAMYEQIIEMGLVKLAIISVIGLIYGFCKAAWDSGMLRDSLLLRRVKEIAKQPVDSGWTPIVEQPLHSRAWARLTGRRGGTSIEVREK